jgi:hypothetical protein
MRMTDVLHPVQLSLVCALDEPQAQDPEVAGSKAASLARASARASRSSRGSW